MRYVDDVKAMRLPQAQGTRQTSSKRTLLSVEPTLQRLQTRKAGTLEASLGKAKYLATLEHKSMKPNRRSCSRFPGFR